jgi:hypothetical protein
MSSFGLRAAARWQRASNGHTHECPPRDGGEGAADDEVSEDDEPDGR